MSDTSKSKALKRGFFLGFPTGTPRFDGCMVVPNEENDILSSELSFSVILVQQTIAASKKHSDTTDTSREISHTEAIQRLLKWEEAHANEPIRISVLGTCYVHLKETFSVSGVCDYPVDKVLLSTARFSKFLTVLSQHKSEEAETVRAAELEAVPKSKAPVAGVVPDSKSLQSSTMSTPGNKSKKNKNGKKRH
jgi:hypothetical protein